VGQNIITVMKLKNMRWAGRVARADRISFVEKPEGNTPFGRPRRREDSNIRTYLSVNG
jgi:hypothetical protein